MRSLIALLVAGLLYAPSAPRADDPAPPRARPAPSRAAPARSAGQPRAAAPRAAQPRVGPSGAPVRVTPSPYYGTRPAPPRASAAVKPAPPRVGTVPPPYRPMPGPYSPRYPYRPYYPVYPYYPYYPYPAFAVGIAPFWWGLGWGWGYYPAYRPYVPYPPEVYVAPPDASPDRTTTLLSLQAAGHTAGGAGMLDIVIEGRHLGFQASIGAVGRNRIHGVATNDSVTLGWGTIHATWSFLSAPSYRLRLEVGASMLSMPDSGGLVGEPYAGTIAFGPNVGVSGHVGLIGPFGVEGHARLTPTPVPVADTRLAAAFRGGPLALTLGWRAIDVSGDRKDGPQLHFSGPELGLALRF